jgi:LysM repeat protein
MPLRRFVPILLAAGILAFSALPMLAQETTHIIQPGENLFRIALRYGIDVDTLATANGISNTDQVYAGQPLIIPAAVTSLAPETAADATLVEDAGILDEALLDQPATEPEPELVEVAEAAEVAESPANPAYHLVGRGETLASIAQRYGMTLEALAQMNDILNPDLVYAGQRLVVGEATTAETELAASESAAAPTQETTHIVRQGEHLAQIAEQYGVSWLAIAQANNIFDPNRVLAGDTLIIPGTQPGAGGGSDLGIVNVPAAPAALFAEGRSIIVDLSDSRIYAYEDGALIRNVLASTGLPSTPTVQGEFRILNKYTMQNMSGPGYYVPDVPWVMYFYGAYAIHGAYWHDNWGVPMSHGCVNLPVEEAEWFYTFATEGTPVRVQL